VGSHINEYHTWVFKKVEQALEGKTGRAAKEALDSVLAELRQALLDNPRLPYSDGGLR
jgi:hypothetical protein